VDGALRVVVRGGRHLGQSFEVVGGVCLVTGLGRQRQPFGQVRCRAVQVAERVAGEGQVVQRDEESEQV
jgi:hypothetical protein